MLRKRRISQKKEQNAGRKAWPKIVANYVMYGIYGSKAGFVLFWKQRWEEPKKNACVPWDGNRDGNGYPSPAYPPGKYPLDVWVWDKKIPMGI
jgi:hypothetical protein